MLAQDEGFHARLRAAVSGGRTVWPDGKRSALLLTYDMDATRRGSRADSMSQWPARPAIRGECRYALYSRADEMVWVEIDVLHSGLDRRAISGDGGGCR